MKPAKRRRRWWAIPRMTVKIVVLTAFFAAIAVPAGAAAGFWALLNADLPGNLPEDTNPRIRSYPTVVVDADGNEIAEFRAFELTVPIRYRDIPEVVKDAVIAIEDQRFWEHKGVDPEGLIRAALANFERRRGRPGRLDHHPAVRQEHLHDRRARRGPQAAGGPDRHPARTAGEQGRDPLPLPEHDLLR